MGREINDSIVQVRSNNMFESADTCSQGQMAARVKSGTKSNSSESMCGIARNHEQNVREMRRRRAQQGLLVCADNSRVHLQHWPRAAEQLPQARRHALLCLRAMPSMFPPRANRVDKQSTIV
jgi:hypothetical protein